MTAVAGIDLSNNQSQTIDWAAVDAAGYEFLWHKITEGATFVDPYIDGRKGRRIDDAQAADLDAGGYLFFRPGVNVAAQVDLFLSHLPNDAQLRPVVDSEIGGPGVAQDTDQVLQLIADEGHNPILYTYSGFAAANFADSNLSRWDLWLANYRSTPPPPPGLWPTYLCWQHADDGTVPGIGTPIDLNVTNNLDALRVTPPPQPEEDMTVAHFVVHAGHPELWLAAPQIDPIPVANTDVAVYVAFCSGLRIDPPPSGAVIVDKPNGVAGGPQKCWSVDDAGAAYFHLPGA